jgi:hypothetical protein
MDRTIGTLGRVAALAVIAAVVLACSTAASPSPPPAASQPAAASGAGPTTASMGTFHDVDGTASGTAALKVLDDGSYAVVFEDFAIDSADHTNVVLVPADDVTASSAVDMTTYVDLGPLKGTSGMQDYPLPSTADAMGLHTVVLWDTEMTHAVAAAPLR